MKDCPPSVEGSVSLLINLGSDDKKIYRKIHSAIAKAPRLLTIELVGRSALTTDLCLSLYELLRTGKHPATKVFLKVNCSLCDGVVLLICAADRIQFAPHRFVRITSQERFSQIIEKCRDQAGVVEEVDENPTGVEYIEILKILNQYLPVEEFADQQIPLEKLAEYFQQDQEDELKRIFAQEGEGMPLKPQKG